MTKYVINSGGINNAPNLRKEFHQELVKDLGSSPKFLLCNFAQPREDWERKFPTYSSAILEDMPDAVNPDFELAMPAVFADQCQQADVIYFHGGDDRLLQHWMEQYDMLALFSGKVVATSSASSDMLAQSYWTCDWRECQDGLDVLPLKFIPHYQSDFARGDPRGPIDWQKAYDELAAYGDKSLPIHALTEGSYIVVET